MGPKTFLFGVGAQRAGTTWLHEYLGARPGADFGYVKEYHVFDALKFPEKITNNFEKRMREALEQGWPAWQGSGIPCSLAMMARQEVYFNYFSGILSKEGINLTGDMTPEYASLEEKTMRNIWYEFSKRGIRVAPVLILRDPVERLHSMVRHVRQEGLKGASSEQVVGELHRFQNSDMDKVRGDYPSTIGNLSRVFGEEVFYGFYEELFNDRSMERLCEFLNVPFSSGKYEKKTDPAPQTATIPEDEKKALVKNYAHRYEFAMEFFGEERIRALWPNAGLLNEDEARVHG